MSDRGKALQWEKKGREDRSLPGGSGGERGGTEGRVGGGVMLQRVSRGESQILTLENHLYDNNYLALSPSLLFYLTVSLPPPMSLSLFFMCVLCSCNLCDLR